eukprot:SAG31_NODE_2729_length_5177_cov_2.657542_6_plen_118_part_00
MTVDSHSVLIPTAAPSARRSTAARSHRNAEETEVAAAMHHVQACCSFVRLDLVVRLDLLFGRYARARAVRTRVVRFPRYSALNVPQSDIQGKVSEGAPMQNDRSLVRASLSSPPGVA